MPIRNAHRVGDYLIEDDESGHIVYASETRKIWDGSIRRHRMFETRQPQEFVKAKNDPKALTEVRPEHKLSAPLNVLLGYVGNTTIAPPSGAASHLFEPGIGQMVIGGSNPHTAFKVR